ncbi:MAG: DUF1295 domain-containing protein [Flavobacteriaceae bacterium]
MDNPKFHIITSIIAFVCSMALAYATDIPILIQLGLLIFGIQWLLYIPAILFKTESFYDITGTLTFVVCTLTVLNQSFELKGFRWEDCIAGACVLIWTLRLGYFLFLRVKRHGDGRFDLIKVSGTKFFMSWTLQGMWVVFCAFGVWTAMLSETGIMLGGLEVLGLCVFITGLLIETIADHQKAAFKKQTQSHNTTGFITSGLWAYSRHPNYFGEVLVWLGLALVAFPALSGWQYLTLVSPVFTYLLLRYVSGVPILEERADEKWGHLEDYKNYKKETPIFFPKFK